MPFRRCQIIALQPPSPLIFTAEAAPFQEGIIRFCSQSSVIEENNPHGINLERLPETVFALTQRLLGQRLLEPGSLRFALARSDKLRRLGYRHEHAACFTPFIRHGVGELGENVSWNGTV